ncbi:copper chaperone PCu(A)C [Sphingomonas sp. TDK1]|uniref:copper chaperone PCu(A)C n=1 Tax=Sphingomonas sp. TDK1 TaxID=453247 RepID=UPI000A0667EA|nr:copper chaperone PCu(A)C [Sphingomonas sp. TDK1]
MRSLAGLLAVTMLAACSPQSDGVKVDGAWIRLPAVAGQPGAAYFTLHGGREAETLVGISTRAADRAEIHESVKDAGGVVKMTPLASIDLPVGSEVKFAPGGKHIMLFGMVPNVHGGEKVPLTLRFASGHTLTAEADVAVPGAEGR